MTKKLIRDTPIVIPSNRHHYHSDDNLASSPFLKLLLPLSTIFYIWLISLLPKSFFSKSFSFVRFSSGSHVELLDSVNFSQLIHLESRFLKWLIIVWRWLTGNWIADLEIIIQQWVEKNELNLKWVIRCTNICKHEKEWA